MYSNLMSNSISLSHYMFTFLETMHRTDLNIFVTTAVLLGAFVCLASGAPEPKTGPSVVSRLDPALRKALLQVWHSKCIYVVSRS